MVVIIKNNSLGQIKWEQIVFLGNPEYGCELYNPNFAMYAEACGGLGITVERPEEIRPALERALASGRPTIVEVVVDPYEPPMPPKVSVEQALHFGVSLYTHNIQVSFLAFALGALTVAGGVWLLFYNGAILGAVAALYVLDGVTGFFLAWVGPHGALEIPAIVFGGAAGLVTGRALLFPGDRSRGSALREAFPDAWRMMAATALILVVAGLVEGSFSQFSSKSFPTGFKIAVAGALFAALMAYLFLRRVEPESG